MKTISRRKALSNLLAGSAGLTLASGMLSESANAKNLSNAEQAITQAPSTTSQAPMVFKGQHQPKALPFDAAKLKGISEKLIKSHWENNYRGAISALNTVEQRLDAMLKEKDLPGFIYADLKREELIRTGSMILHEQYFGNLGGDGKAGGKVLELINKWFGSLETWEADFRKTAAGLSGGSGWVTLSYNLYTGELHNYWAWDHSNSTPLGRPLLVLDMYEHAYQMDYGSAAAKYIDAFMLNVNWEEVNRRAEAATKISLA
jgi:Fe-Mn family superoxide dismutase